MAFLDVLSAGLDVVSESIEETEAYKQEAMQLELEALLKKYDGLGIWEGCAYIGYGQTLEKRLMELSFGELYDWWIEYKDYKDSNSFTKIMEEIERRNCKDRMWAQFYYLKCNDNDQVIQDRIFKIYDETLSNNWSPGIFVSFLDIVFQERMPYLSSLIKNYKTKMLVKLGIIFLLFGFGIASCYEVIPLKMEKPYITIWIIGLLVFIIALILNGINAFSIYITQMKYNAVVNAINIEIENKEKERSENQNLS